MDIRSTFTFPKSSLAVWLFILGISFPGALVGEDTADKPQGSKVLVVVDGAKFLIQPHTRSKVVRSAQLGEVVETTAAQGVWLWSPVVKGWIDRRSVVPLNRAVQELTRTINQGPTREALQARVVAWLNRGEVDQAIADCDALVDLQPNNPTRYELRGEVKVIANHLEDALEDFAKALEFKQRTPRLYRRRGATYFGLRRFGEAKADFERAIELGPATRHDYLNRGVSQYMLGKFGKAIDDFTEAAKQDNSDGFPTYLESLVLAHQGKYESAIRKADDALRRNPQLYFAFLLRSACHEKLGNTAAAVQDRKSFEDLAPRYERPLRKLQPYAHSWVLRSMLQTIDVNFGPIPYLVD